MNNLLRSLTKYHDSYFVNYDGEKFLYRDVLRLIEQYTQIIERTRQSGDSETTRFKNAVLVKKSCPVHTIAIVIACFATDSVAILMPYCLDSEEKEITREYPHNYIFQGQELQYKPDNSFYNVNYPNDINLIIFSSGTNGKIRGVMLSKKNFVTNVEAGVQHFPVIPRSNIVNILPLFHAYGLNVATLALIYSGCNIYFANSFTYQKTVEHVEPTYFFLTPELIKMHRSIHLALGFTKSWGTNAKYVFCGGDFVEESIREYLKKNNLELFCSYGLTESAPSVSAESFNLKKRGSVGRPINNIKVKIVDNEIVVLGPDICYGYFDEWVTNGKIYSSKLHTGDLGYIDADGFLFVTGRLKNLLVFRDGKKCTAEYIEQAVKNQLGEIQIFVYKHNEVLHADYYGEFEVQDVREALGTIISPHHIEFEITKKTDSLNKTFSGKIKRGKNESYSTASNRDITIDNE